MVRRTSKSVENFIHDEASRKYIPTAELESLVNEEDKTPIEVTYERRNPDLDPQLVWRGKDLRDRSELVVQAPPLYIQEKIHPKVLIDDLQRMTAEKGQKEGPQQLDFFADFNGLPSEAAKTEFYQHDANWSNRMILGDSLQVMASLAEREGLRGQVQCIYIDPPYGIKFNSNFQWSTTSRDVKDGKTEHITREPEQVKAFRDTWRDGIHSYLSYLRDRLIVAHELLSVSGSLFLQIGDENIHRIRILLDEVFGEHNYMATIHYRTTGGFSTKSLSRIGDYILWYAKSIDKVKVRQLYTTKSHIEDTNYRMIEDDSYKSRSMTKAEQNGYSPLPDNVRIYRFDNSTGQGAASGETPIELHGKVYHPPRNTHWKASYPLGMNRLKKADRLYGSGNTISYKRYFDDYKVKPITTIWLDTGVSGFSSNKQYVVETLPDVVERCVLSGSDPGDLILDPTCGSGTTAYVAEEWGRRWITIDTSRVALALARVRIMGARYPYYLLKDSREGQIKEAELTRTMPPDTLTYGKIRQGFVYERVPHIMLSTIANNAEIDVIWEEYQETLEPLRNQINHALGENWQEWEIPRKAKENWTPEVKHLHARWWQTRIERQKEIGASIAAKADFEYLYDKPYEENNKVRVAGPFTVESLSPHRMLGVDENDELIDNVAEGKAGYAEGQSFIEMILQNLKTAGVQQAHKEDKINFSSLTPWPGEYICAEGRYFEGNNEKDVQKRAAIFLGPEFGTVARPDLVAAAREAADAGFDVLIACAFNYDAQSTEFDKLGRVPVLKARMNADLHMADDLKNTGKGNLFVIFGEPDIDILDAENGQIRVKINGVDVFDPSTGEVRSDSAEGIACWFIDTDYNEESFFVRHAYFLGANDPYKSLKTTLKAEINREAWESLHSDTSRPFEKPESGRIAVKVINHLGDEVMKVFRVG
jgi:adenine-specific DNA-methyltransferase